MATTTSSASPYTPTGAGFQNPHFPNHNGPHDAHVVIYGYAFSYDLALRISPKRKFETDQCPAQNSYTPSLALCILGMILYAISTVAHLFQVIRYRVWNFAPLTLACLLETTGYIFRTLSSQNDPYSIIWFVVQYFLIVVAPVFISASIYFSINRLIAWAASTTAFNDVSDNKQRRWWLSPKLILWGFIIADVLTTSMQIAGAALVGSSESNYRNQTRVITSCSLGWRSRRLLLLFFCLSCCCFGSRLAETSARETMSEAKRCLCLRWQVRVFSYISGQYFVWQRLLKGCLVMCRRMRSSLGHWSLRRSCLRSGSLRFGIRGDGWSGGCRLYHLHLYRMRSILPRMRSIPPRNELIFSRGTEDGGRQGYTCSRLCFALMMSFESTDWLFHALLIDHKCCAFILESMTGDVFV